MATIYVNNLPVELTQLTNEALVATAEANRMTPDDGDRVHEELQARRIWIEWNQNAQVEAWGYD